MDERLLLLSTFRFLNIDAPDGIYPLMPGVDILVGESFKARYLTNEFGRMAGAIENYHFTHVGHLVVGDIPLSFFESLSPDIILATWLGWVDWLIQDSWLIKDNAIACEIAYCMRTSKGQTSWSNNGLYSRLTNASGMPAVTTSFNLKDIERWSIICNSVRELIFASKGVMGGQVSDKGYSKFARFYNFVDTSRRTAYPSIKIAHCCSALESLFSTDTVELSHRLSERVAVLFAGQGEDPEDVYKFTKDCYAVRSSVTHGSPVSSRLTGRLDELSIGMLDRMRKVVELLLVDKELVAILNGSNEGIETYFRKLLFHRK